MRTALFLLASVTALAATGCERAPVERVGIPPNHPQFHAYQEPQRGIDPSTLGPTGQPAQPVQPGNPQTSGPVDNTAPGTVLPPPPPMPGTDAPPPGVGVITTPGK